MGIITGIIKLPYTLAKGVCTAGKTSYKVGKTLTKKATPFVDSKTITDYVDLVQTKHGNIAEFVRKNPEHKKTLDDCVETSVKKYKKSQLAADLIDTADKATSTVGLFADYLILTTPHGFALALAEEAVEAAFKVPFMAHYARKNAWAVPKLALLETASHLLPFGDIIDFTNTYSKQVKKDTVKDAAKAFKKEVGIYNPTLREKAWGAVKGMYSGIREKIGRKTPAPIPIPLPVPQPVVYNKKAS